MIKILLSNNIDNIIIISYDNINNIIISPRIRILRLPLVGYGAQALHLANSKSTAYA